ncbi:MAG: hypothetical protein J6W03_10445 [Bacteroidaceae bacterium]|nr:hypothetical protein [Bacteroidaceae bacterium]
MKRLLLLLFAVVAGAMTAAADDYVELLTNGAPDGTFDGWNITNGGNGWVIKSEVDGYFFCSSHGVCVLWQDIILSEKGFSAEDVDANKVICVASADVRQGVQKNGNGAKVNKITVFMLDGDDATVGSIVLVDELTYYEGWKFYQQGFRVVAGTRKLQYKIESQDAIYWAGQYGPNYRNLSLKAKVGNVGRDCDVDGHEWSEWTEVTPVSCTEDGVNTRTCSFCGKTDTLTIPALGHLYGDDGVCSRCGATFSIPDDIELLSYIESSRQQTFNTKYIHKANTKVVMDCEVIQNQDNGYEALFGSRLGNYQHNSFVFFSRFNSQDRPCYSRSGEEPSGSDFVYEERITVVAYGQTATWYKATNPGTAAGSMTTNGTADDGKNPMFIFNLNTSPLEGGLQEDGSWSVMKLYGFKIYEDDVLLHDFVPAKKGDVAGLLDMRTGLFDGSMNSTPFIAGVETPTIYPITLAYNSEQGLVEVDKAEAMYNEEVQVTVTPSEDYMIESIEVLNADGKTINCTLASTNDTQSVYTFVMPASSVAVSVTFKSTIVIIKEPEPLPYIRSTGQQTFNTNYIHKANTRVVMDCEVKNQRKDYEALFGARLGNYQHNSFVFFSRFGRQDNPCYSRSGEEPSGSNFVYGERITLVASGQTATWYRASDPETVAGSLTTSGTADEGKNPMFIFNLNTSDTEGGLQEDGSWSAMKLYGFKIYEDEDLIHDFVPAQIDDVVGLYDMVTGYFDGSMSETPFIAGSDTDDPAYPITLEYGEEGQVQTNFNEATEGSMVNVSIIPNEGYYIRSIEVQDANGNSVPTDLTNQTGFNRTYSFVMPASSVTVKVSFYEPPTLITTIPDGCEIKDFLLNSFSITSSWYGLTVNETNGHFVVAFDPTNDKVYIQNILWYVSPDSPIWVEGTYDSTTGIISIPTGQCVYWNYNNAYGLELCWGSTDVYEDGTDSEGNPQYYFTYEVNDTVTSIQFKLDGNNLYLLNAVSNSNADFPTHYVCTGMMAIWTDDDSFCCAETSIVDESGQNAPFATLVIEEPLIPADPAVSEWYDCGDESGFSRLYFTLPDKSIDGKMLVPENLSYSVFVNNGNGAELFTFPAEDYTFDLSEDITEVPYSLYSSATDFKSNYCYFYRTNTEGYEPLFTNNIGLQVYYTANGVRLPSRIVWLYDDPDGVTEINANDNAEQGIYNLSGQRIGKLQKGINIVGGKKILK